MQIPAKIGLEIAEKVRKFRLTSGNGPGMEWLPTTRGGRPRPPRSLTTPMHASYRPLASRACRPQEASRSATGHLAATLTKGNSKETRVSCPPRTATFLERVRVWPSRTTWAWNV